jgi:hypothetical protein
MEGTMDEPIKDKFYYVLLAIAIFLALFVLGGMAVIGYRALRPSPWVIEPTPTLFLPPSVFIPSPTPGNPTLTPENTSTPGGATTGTPAQIPTSTPEGCTDIAAFVADVTIPDNTVMAPNQPFTKTWRLRNDGTCTWTNQLGLTQLSIEYRRDE